jgi:tyrosyl-tRNA synthetase
MISAEEQLDLLCRGVVDMHVKAELLERLKTGKPLKIKAGFDPTRPDLHLGHTVVMSKMRQFQDFGHHIVFIVGDFTALVGDPTGRNDLRPPLTREEIKAAAETYQQQAFKVLDKDKTEVVYNSSWLDKLTPAEIIELGAKYTVARMLEREDFKTRFEAQRPIHMHELMYPLLQAYDSVHLENDVELGGTDQLFNLLVARDVMPRYGKRAQIVMTMPILEGINARVENGKVVGAKMSKSLGNYVGVNEPPSDMLNKLMLVDDGVIWRYMELLSTRTNDEITALKKEVEGGRNVIEIKEAFAKEIVTRFHSVEDADAALAKRRNVASGAVPTDVEETTIACDGEGIWIAKAMSEAGLTKSTSEAARLVKGGAVLVDGAKVEEKHQLAKGGRYLVRVGSKNKVFRYLIVG